MWKRLAVLVVLLAALILSTGTEAKAGTRVRAWTITPANGEEVSGSVRWKAKARPRPRRVKFLIDGTLRARDTTFPYVYKWDTTRDGDGVHRLTVRGVWRKSKSSSKTHVVVSNPPALQPTGCLAGEYEAQYFDNAALSGTSVFTRCEPAPLDHQWETGSPNAGLPPDHFSARWVGSFAFDAARYAFTAVTDDGMRVYIDGELAFERWLNQDATTYTFTRDLTAGMHVLKVEYYEDEGSAVANLSWGLAEEATSTSTWPASYFTGPAGQNNILPPNGTYPTNGAFLGITPGGPGTTYESATQDVLDLEAYIGKRFDIVQRFAGGCSFPTSTANDMVSRGWIFMTSWQFHPYLRDVLNGSQDACITQYAQGAAAWGRRFFLRIFWEFNGDWFQNSFYQPGVRATAIQQRDAWRHVVDVMSNAGLTKASFVWAPGEGHYANNDIMDESVAYPGDDYVDWVSADGYNLGRSFDWCGGGDGPSLQGWCPLELVLHDRFNQPDGSSNVEHDFRGRKPYMPSEIGSNEGESGQKGQLFVDGLAAIKAKFPGLYGFVYFHVNTTSTEGCCNWRLDSSTSALEGFKALATDPFFNRL
jgi:hypothetical protein